MFYCFVKMISNHTSFIILKLYFILLTLSGKNKFIIIAFYM
nr:MAG TPA: hypothetical protein [Caudoviricetes sp.]